jgi:histidinol-phosphatase (PHP family)
MWTNYHSHSKYCDGKGELHEYVEVARTNKLISMGFSSHAPVPFDCKWCMRQENFPQYKKDIEQLKAANTDIEIYSGLEVDFIPGVISPLHYRDQLDYTIGSIHFVDILPDGRHWEIDNSQAVFQEGLEKIFKNNIKDAMVRYFELTKEMIYHSTIDIVGHLDKIKMQNADNKYFSENDKWYQEQVLSLLKLIDQADIIVEVNTRGIYQKKTKDTYPGTWVLEQMFKKNIPVTISSDAHIKDDLVNQFPETAKLLSKIGYKTVSALRGGKWVQLPFTADGITG